MSPLGANTEVERVIEIVPDLGVIGLLVVIIFGGYRGWWVFGWQYKDLLTRHEKLREDRDFWQEIAIRATNLTETLAKLKRGGR